LESTEQVFTTDRVRPVKQIWQLKQKLTEFTQIILSLDTAELLYGSKGTTG
jgi:hypothetical protein